MLTVQTGRGETIIDLTDVNALVGILSAKYLSEGFMKSHGWVHGMACPGHMNADQANATRFMMNNANGTLRVCSSFNVGAPPTFQNNSTYIDHSSGKDFIVDGSRRMICSTFDFTPLSSFSKLYVKMDLGNEAVNFLGYKRCSDAYDGCK